MLVKDLLIVLIVLYLLTLVHERLYKPITLFDLLGYQRMLCSFTTRIIL